MAKKILIVEDESSLSQAMSIVFKKEGIETIVAENGEIGLQKAKKEHPDLILLDIVMPVMDGITMLHKLREDEWGKNVKVIFLTNLNDEGKIREAQDDKVIDFYIKSNWNIIELVNKVKDIA